MAEHSLATGRTMIDALAELGQALGYRQAREWRIPGKTAAVDVAWLHRREDLAPLIAFEVESRPGEGLANNVVKLLGRSGAQQPLHLFQVVMRGGNRSSRPQDVTEVFGTHNYSLHLLTEQGEPKQLLKTVLDVHRRVADHIDGVALAEALAGEAWPADVLEPLLQYAEGLGFRGLSERSYTVLALRAPGFRVSLTRKLLRLWQQELGGQAEPPNRYYEPEQPREEQYGSYMSAAGCEAIELGLIAALEPHRGRRAFELLKRWQEFNHIGDQLGPFTGAGCQWSEYIVDNIGYYWALVAALMEGVPGARAWCAAQPAALFDAVSQADHQSVDLLGVWVMHIAAGVEGCTGIYERVRARLEANGGIDRSWLLEPQPGSPGEEDEVELLGDGLAPTAEALLHLMRGRDAPPTDAVELALRALLDDPAFRPADGATLAALLARKSKHGRLIREPVAATQ